VASNTSRIRLGPCITDPYSRHPIITAVAIGSLAELAPDRVWLGIGAGGRGLAEIGITQPRPAVAIREAVNVIRSLLDGQSVDYRGEIILLKDRPLDFKPPTGIKIMIGTGHGRIVQQLAGEIADAVMLANYAVPETIQKGLQNVEKGASKAGRRLADCYLISRVDVAIHEDGAIAKAAVAPKILSALRASYPDLSYLDDLPEFQLSSRLIEALKKKDYQSRMYYANPANSTALIPATLTRNLAVAGTPEEVKNQMLQIIAMDRFHEIAIRPVLCPEQGILSMLSLFQKAVVPHIQVIR
jgi:5,10-methylenetetrahydromethanopterin reductase